MRAPAPGLLVVGVIVAAIAAVALRSGAEEASGAAPATGDASAAPAAEGDRCPPSEAALGVEHLLGQLRDRSDALERRERELAERERSLDDVKAEVARSIGELDEMRSAVDARVAALEKLHGDGVGRLAKVFSQLPPARAASLLEELDFEAAGAVLARMKPKESAAVLAAMSEERALRLSRGAVLPLPEQQTPPVAAGSGPPANADEEGTYR